MENKNPNPVKDNLLVTLRGRRIQNFKNQFKSVVLEGYEIFGEEVVNEVLTECQQIYQEYKELKLAFDE